MANKKGLLILVLAVCIAGSAFAEFRFSIGAGGYFTSDFGGGADAQLSGPVYYEHSIKTPYFGGGGFLFFDLSFAELSFGFFGAKGEMNSSRNINVSGASLIKYSKAFSTTYSGMDFGLFFKIPFSIGDKFSLFPLLGIDYLVMSSVKVEDIEYSDPTDFSALWFKTGIGFDFLVNKHLFFRLNALYGLRLPNKFDLDEAGSLKLEYDIVDAILGSRSGRHGPNLGHGLTVKLAIGYRF